jgi:hypothetical protein
MDRFVDDIELIKFGDDGVFFFKPKVEIGIDDYGKTMKYIYIK